MQLYDLMDDIAQDRLEQICKYGKFEQEGYKKGTKIENVVNTIIGSVQREVKTSMTKRIHILAEILKLGFNFYQTHIEVGFTDFSKLGKDSKTGEYNHIKKGFIMNRPRPRSRPIELNDDEIEMDLDRINQMDTYIGDNTDEDSDLKKKENQTDPK